MSPLDILLVCLITFGFNAAQTILFLYYGPKYTKKRILDEATYSAYDEETDKWETRLSPEFESILAGIVGSKRISMAAGNLVNAIGQTMMHRINGMYGGIMNGVTNAVEGVEAEALGQINPMGAKMLQIAKKNEKLGPLMDLLNVGKEFLGNNGGKQTQLPANGVEVVSH